MYSTAQLLENAKRFTSAKISESSVIELKDVARAVSVPTFDFTDITSIKSERSSKPHSDQYNESKSAEHAVFVWLKKNIEQVTINRGFLDFIV